nr:hypothetical protein [uncultured Halomonas sp.]
MTDKVSQFFSIPKSLKKRQRGLLESHVDRSHPYAENLELLTAEGKAAGMENMLASMRSELDRLLVQTDPGKDPDTYNEILWAAITGDVLVRGDITELRADQREEYICFFSFLYGRLTKPSDKSSRESGRVHIKAMFMELGRSKGGKKGAKTKKEEAARLMAEAQRLHENYAAHGRPTRGIAQLVSDRMGVSVKTVRKWRQAGWK